jgi:hypothetical protein
MNNKRKMEKKNVHMTSGLISQAHLLPLSFISPWYAKGKFP